MNCRQCGKKIPADLLKLDSFRCPECGRLYRRKNPQAMVASSTKTPAVINKPKKKKGILGKIKSFLLGRTLKLPVWFCLIALVCLMMPVLSPSNDASTPPEIDATVESTIPPTAVPVEATAYAVLEEITTEPILIPIEATTAAPTAVPTEEVTIISTKAPAAKPAQTATEKPKAKVTATPIPLQQQQIKPGDSGEKVVALQKRLIALGFLSGSADGYFGKDTQAAVKAYQKAAGLEQSGICDYNTYASMTSSSAPKTKAAQKKVSSGSSNSSESVWIAPHSGKKYHKSQGCQHLKKAVSTQKISKDEAKRNGYSACKTCYG